MVQLPSSFVASSLKFDAAGLMHPSTVYMHSASSICLIHL